MRVLGIESSSTTASVAIIEDDRLVCEYTMNNTLKHSRTLMPMLEDMLNRMETDIDTIDLVAVSEGPGSFTGLRIGSATAKGIAQGLDIKVASVPTLQVLASRIQVPDAMVGAVVHARAREVYYATYRIEFNDGHFFTVENESITSLEVEDLIEMLKKQEVSGDFYLVGDGVERFKDEFLFIEDKYCLPAPIYCSFSAQQVALLGLQMYNCGNVMTYYEQKPYYHKKIPG